MMSTCVFTSLVRFTDTDNYVKSFNYISHRSQWPDLIKKGIDVLKRSAPLEARVIHYHLAFAYYKLRQFETALKHCEEGVKGCKSVTPEDDAVHIQLLDLQANVFYDMSKCGNNLENARNLDQAEQVASLACDICRNFFLTTKKDQEERLLMGKICHTFGNLRSHPLNIAVGKNAKKAFRNYSEALLGLNFQDKIGYFLTLQDLAYMLLAQNDFEELIPIMDELNLKWALTKSFLPADIFLRFWHIGSQYYFKVGSYDICKHYAKEGLELADKNPDIPIIIPGYEQSKISLKELFQKMFNDADHREKTFGNTPPPKKKPVVKQQTKMNPYLVAGLVGLIAIAVFTFVV